MSAPNFKDPIEAIMWGAFYAAAVVTREPEVAVACADDGLRALRVRAKDMPEGEDEQPPMAGTLAFREWMARRR